jgi:hypothetical protein
MMQGFVIKKRNTTEISVMLWEYQEHLGDVAGAEDLVDSRELVGLVRREVGGEGAVLCAAPAEELARRARGHRVQDAAKAKAARDWVFGRRRGGGGGDAGRVRFSLDLLADLIESLPGGRPKGRVVT